MLRTQLSRGVSNQQAMGTSMDVIQHVGLLDEDPRLRTAEDGEWAYRALRAGVPIIYAPEVAVRHFGWRDDSKRRTQYRDYARSHGGFYGKYLRQGDWFIALRVLVHLVRALHWWLRGTMNGDQELTVFGRAYLTGLLPGILAGMRRRKSP
jgi:GT2 family glycosyltransferase